MGHLVQKQHAKSLLRRASRLLKSIDRTEEEISEAVYQTELIERLIDRADGELDRQLDLWERGLPE